MLYKLVTPKKLCSNGKGSVFKNLAPATKFCSHKGIGAHVRVSTLPKQLLTNIT